MHTKVCYILVTSNGLAKRGERGVCVGQKFFSFKRERGRENKKGERKQHKIDVFSLFFLFSFLYLLFTYFFVLFLEIDKPKKGGGRGGNMAKKKFEDKAKKIFFAEKRKKERKKKKETPDFSFSPFFSFYHIL